MYIYIISAYYNINIRYKYYTVGSIGEIKSHIEAMEHELNFSLAWFKICLLLYVHS